MLLKKVNLFKKIVLKKSWNKLMEKKFLFLVVFVLKVVLKTFVLARKMMQNVARCVNVKIVKILR